MSDPAASAALRRLPHAGPARFVTDVIETGDDHLACTGRIPGETPLAVAGRVPGFVLLEFAAQAAALDILMRQPAGSSTHHAGYVARVRSMQLSPEGVPADEPLIAHVHRERAIPPLFIYRATVSWNGAEVLRGEMSLYVDERS